jgi:cytochrome c6
MKNILTFGAIVISLSMVASPAFAGDAAKGKTNFVTLCASCHGNEGAGDGPVAMALPPDQKPRNLQTEAMKFAVDEAKFSELLKKGGAAVGLNALMPMQATLTDPDIADLYAYVKTLKK